MVTTLQIRDVPEELHDVIAARAKAAGMSISQFLLRIVEREASRPTNAEVLERAAQLAARRGRKVGADEIVSALHEGRAER
ncbi:MAG TPA: hypothetical protein VF069_00185 [Streptosporangiaceae bacterium]